MISQDSTKWIKPEKNIKELEEQPRETNLNNNNIIIIINKRILPLVHWMGSQHINSFFLEFQRDMKY